MKMTSEKVNSISRSASCSPHRKLNPGHKVVNAQTLPWERISNKVSKLYSKNSI